MAVLAAFLEDSGTTGTVYLGGPGYRRSRPHPTAQSRPRSTQLRGQPCPSGPGGGALTGRAARSNRAIHKCIRGMVKITMPRVYRNGRASAGLVDAPGLAFRRPVIWRSTRSDDVTLTQPAS